MAENIENKHENVYQKVTKRILDMMMSGLIPWRIVCFPKKGEPAPYRNYFTGRPYNSLINRMLLGEPGEYATFNQIKDHKGHVKKGAKGKMVIYWGEYVPKDKKEEYDRLVAAGENADHLKVKFPKQYLLFNIKDTEGVVFKGKEEEQGPEMQEAEAPTDIVNMVLTDYNSNEGVSVNELNISEPVYDPMNDSVSVPLKGSFPIEEDYYASVFTGIVHSTATENRCNRDKEYQKIKEGEMSVKEELIGEIGSSMILMACGLERKETHTQITAVCQKWIEAMNKDYRLIITASTNAEKAAKYVLGQFAA